MQPYTNFALLGMAITKSSAIFN